MRICIDTRSIHPHMAPLAARLNMLLSDADRLTYVYRSTPSDPNRAEGAKGLVDDIALFWDGEKDDAGRTCVMTSDILLENHRDFELMEERLQDGRLTIYQSERWFKPVCLRHYSISGFFRMILPFGIRRAIKVMKLFKYEKFYYFPLGLHAASDMARLCGLMHGDLRCIFCAPKLQFERTPCGKIWLKGGGDGKKYCLDKMRMWGYYVEPSRVDARSAHEASKQNLQKIKVLWVGRLLDWKRVDTIVRAVGEHARLRCINNSLPEMTLDIYGEGPEKPKLQRLSEKYGPVIKFYPPIPYSKVRMVMHEHDVYVLPSNSFEGWGAVVNEALEEGMRIVASYDAGASTVLLPRECWFRAGDVEGLLKLLNTHVPNVVIGDWSAMGAAKKFIKFVEGLPC